MTRKNGRGILPTIQDSIAYLLRRYSGYVTGMTVHPETMNRIIADLDVGMTSPMGRFNPGFRIFGVSVTVRLDTPVNWVMIDHSSGARMDVDLESGGPTRRGGSVSERERVIRALWTRLQQLEITESRPVGLSEDDYESHTEAWRSGYLACLYDVTEVLEGLGLARMEADDG